MSDTLAPVIPDVIPAVKPDGPAIAPPIVKKQKPRGLGIFSQVILNRKVSLHITEVGRNLFRILLEKISSELEGKCTVEGYIKPDSIRMISSSGGTLYGASIEYTVAFECLLCCPVEGMIINRCIAENITKAGIRAKTQKDPSPLTIFVARDHHYDNTYFSTIKEKDEITIRVIGIRYELNDPTISVIAELVKPRVKPRVIMGKQ